MKGIAVLGSTGSIGRATLDVIQRHRDRFRAVALAAAGNNLDRLIQQVKEHEPELVAVMREEAAKEIEAAFPHVRVAVGEEALLEAASLDSADVVVGAVVGFAGLPAALAALKAGKRLALANKETLVAAGHLVMKTAKEHGAEIIPVDSEHSAIFQAIAAAPTKRVRKIYLTASGGPFRRWSRQRMAKATVEDALMHPTWVMGKKITIDSATMMNKGLEIIEAHHLFKLPEERIEVLVHRESIVHSIVEFTDSSMIAQMGRSDMRVPIAVALSWPDRLETDLPSLDLLEVGPLHFEPPDEKRFPALKLARWALKQGGTYPTALNAANEVAVEAFLNRQIGFLRITWIVERVLEAWSWSGTLQPSLDEVMAADSEARRMAKELVERQVRGN